MSRMFRGCALALSLLLLMQTQALAWHDTGHMVVAQIAYDRLQPRARERVDALVKTIRFCGRTYDGVTISVWMDDIKSDSTHDELSEWHYINTPIFDGIAPNPNLKLPENNVITRTTWVIQMLRKGTGSDKKDAELLGYLFHLAGDIHQPMHAVTRFSAQNPDGDLGGNRFRVNLPEVTNLHAYWDAAADLFHFWSAERPMSESTRRRFGQYVRMVVSANPPNANLNWQVTEPRTWAQESFELGRNVAYGLPENSTPTAAYTERARTIASARLALAGYRLAHLLNTLYPEQTPR